MSAMPAAMCPGEHAVPGPHPPRPGQVLVFRTSVNDLAQVDLLRPLLDLTIAGSGEWNFDLEDREHILRVDAEGPLRERITALLNVNGFACNELE